jgi:hypothetical protein
VRERPEGEFDSGDPGELLVQRNRTGLMHRTGVMDTTLTRATWARAGRPDLWVRDLRHTVGRRLREAGVREETIADILWHSRPQMTAHYSVAQVHEIREALERITDEKHANNVSLASLIRDSRKVPAKVPAEAKLGPSFCK